MCRPAWSNFLCGYTTCTVLFVDIRHSETMKESRGQYYSACTSESQGQSTTTATISTHRALSAACSSRWCWASFRAHIFLTSSSGSTTKKYDETIPPRRRALRPKPCTTYATKWVSNNPYRQHQRQHRLSVAQHASRVFSLFLSAIQSATSIRLPRSASQSSFVKLTFSISRHIRRYTGVCPIRGVPTSNTAASRLTAGAPGVKVKAVHKRLIPRTRGALCGDTASDSCATGGGACGPILMQCLIRVPIGCRGFATPGGMYRAPEK